MKFKYIPQKFLDIFIHANIYLSLGAASTIYASCLLLGLQPDIELLLTAFFVTFSVYNINRITDKEEDSISYPERYNFIKKYENYLIGASIVMYILALFFVTRGGIGAVLIVLIPLVVICLYSLKWLFARKPYSLEIRGVYGRFKEIPLIKNFVASYTWSLCMVFLPVFYFSHIPTISIFAVFIFLFGRDIINTITFDIRDIKGDKAHNILTLPVLYGIKNTREILTICNILLCGVMISFTFFGWLSLWAYGVIILSTLYTQFYLWLIQKSLNVTLLYDIIIDGEFITFGIFTLLSKMLIGM